MLKLIKTDDLKKGDRVVLAGGRQGWIRDNKRGGIARCVEIDPTVGGYFADIGDTYVWEILYLMDADRQLVAKIELTPNQLKRQRMIRELGW